MLGFLLFLLVAIVSVVSGFRHDGDCLVRSKYFCVIVVYVLYGRLTEFSVNSRSAFLKHSCEKLLMVPLLEERFCSDSLGEQNGCKY